MNIDKLIASFPLISDQITRDELRVVLYELTSALSKGIDGDVVEFGCYAGTTSLFIRRVLDDAGQPRQFHVYDSFEGLPEKTSQDHNAAGVDFVAGELAVSKKQFLHALQQAHLVPPIAHKAWFNDLTEKDVPKQIAFAFLDGDFYESIKTSLALVWPGMTEGGKILVHDYKRETLPGVERAVHEFLQGKPYKRLGYSRNVAIIQL